jgi:hypothetical protein
MSYDRNQIIADTPLLRYCQERGFELKRSGRQWVCLCPLHREDTPSFSIDADKDVWHCFGCAKGGSIIDLHAALRGISVREAIAELSRDGGNGNDSTAHSSARQTAAAMPAREPRSQEPRGREVAAYDYEDATGRVVFQVVRFEPKDFRQCRIVDDKRVWNIEGIERVPYRLPDLLASPASVWIVEGEKDVETLRSVGQTATCNPGGAQKWHAAYSQYLRGQHVYLVPDRDQAGDKHMRAVLKSLEGVVEWVRWIELPAQYDSKPIKDITDLSEACQSNDAFLESLEHLQRTARLIERGIESRGYTFAELEAAYKATLALKDSLLLLGNWLPKLGACNLAPGDMLGIVADTGQLKSAALLNILASNPRLAAVLFSLELDKSQMFERMAAISVALDAEKVREIYRDGGEVDWRKRNRFGKTLVYTDPMTMGAIDEEIARSSAKLDCAPKIVAIDYVQLIDARGSRYERLSDAAESARRLAKKHGCIVIVLSQVARKGNDAPSPVREITLHDAKDSGSFENSCSLLLGLWKINKSQMRCRILKNSRGLSGNTVTMDILGGSYRIVPLGEDAVE